MWNALVPVPLLAFCYKEFELIVENVVAYAKDLMR